jgi:hypothetical protein
VLFLSVRQFSPPELSVMLLAEEKSKARASIVGNGNSGLHGPFTAAFLKVQLAGAALTTPGEPARAAILAAPPSSLWPSNLTNRHPTPPSLRA